MGPFGHDEWGRTIEEIEYDEQQERAERERKERTERERNELSASKINNALKKHREGLADIPNQIQKLRKSLLSKRSDLQKEITKIDSDLKNLDEIEKTL